MIKILFHIRGDSCVVFFFSFFSGTSGIVV